METQKQNTFTQQNAQDTLPEQDFRIRTMQDDLTNSSGASSTSQIKTLPVQKAAVASSNPFSESTQVAPENSLPKPNKQIEKTRELRENNIAPSALPIAAKKEGRATLIMFVATIFIILIAIGLGSYYYFMTRVTQAPQQPEPVAETPVEIIEPVIINPVSEKYSFTKPNYLPIDTAETSSSAILKTLSDVASDIDSSASKTPVEFIIVDTNNNPVVFHIFASAIGLKLSAATLANLGENFSVFYFKDSSATRIGLAIDLKNQASLKTILLKEEPALLRELTPLFLGTKIEKTSATFNDSIYTNNAIRYLNINSQNTLSIDYALTDKQLLIGTSKDTLRQIIDKVSASVAPTTADNVSNIQEIPLPLSSTDNTPNSNSQILVNSPLN